MKELFSRTVFSYILGLLAIVVLTGIILSYAVENAIMLVFILFFQYVVLMVMLYHVFDKYVKPVRKAVHTVDELLKGNYRARIRYTANGSIGQLNQKINRLARQLSELAFHEQIQSEQLKTVIDNTVSGLVLIDEKGYIHLVNRRVVNMFGKTARDYIGYLYYDVLNNEKIHQTIQQTFLYEKNVKDSFVHYKGIEKYYLEVVGAPIFNERQLLKGAVLVLYDITELKKLETMRKDFVANVSHELQTPITSIKGFSETLLDGAKDDRATREEFLKIIHKESERLQFLIDDLLMLSKLEKDEYEPEMTAFTMNDLIKEITPVIKQKAARKRISFTDHLQSDVHLSGDVEQIRQMLMNLLDNAINYTPEHGKVSLSIVEIDDAIRIQVDDTGIGMDESVLPRIFERFYRVDAARSRNTGGTGLGLAIVKHIVEVHGGQITVDSQPDRGTRFVIHLPQHHV